MGKARKSIKHALQHLFTALTSHQCCVSGKIFVNILHISNRSIMNRLFFVISRHRTFTKLALGAAAALSCSLAVPANAARGGAGWQGKFTLDIPSGQIDQFFHYACPVNFPVAVSGGFLPNLAAKSGMVVLGNGPRLDLNPTSYNEWSWIIDWPKGAPAGSSINFDVYCMKEPA